MTIVGSGATKVIVGVTSFGDQHCAGAGDHGVYTRLYAFREWVNRITAVSVPSAPREVKAVPGPREGQITITWAPPTSDGDSLITSYHLYFGTEDPDHENHEDDRGEDEHRSPRDLTHTFSGLDPKVAYRFTIGAENTAGLGTSVTPSPVRPGVKTPAAISRPAAGRLGVALSKGVGQRIRCSRRCTAQVDLRVSPDIALRYGLGSNTTVGTVRSKLKSGRKAATVTAKFTSAARRKLKAARFLMLTVATSATSPGYVAQEKNWTLTLRR